MIIGICDDEKDVRAFLQQKIEQYTDADILLYEAGEALMQSDTKPDILFLDIQMPGTDGMQIARQIRECDKSMQIVFVTGIEDYVFEAFDVEALNYLVKPIDDKKLEAVLKIAQEKITNSTKPIDTRQSIVVSAGGIHTKIYLDDIIYAEVFNRKIMIHTTSENIEYYGKLTELEDMAGENFFRPHRAYLINMKYVERYDATNIYLEKGQVLMAKQNYKNFVRRYMEYTMKGLK